MRKVRRLRREGQGTALIEAQRGKLPVDAATVERIQADEGALSAAAAALYLGLPGLPADVRTALSQTRKPRRHPV